MTRLCTWMGGWIGGGVGLCCSGVHMYCAGGGLADCLVEERVDGGLDYLIGGRNVQEALNSLRVVLDFGFCVYLYICVFVYLYIRRYVLL